MWMHASLRCVAALLMSVSPALLAAEPAATDLGRLIASGADTPPSASWQGEGTPPLMPDDNAPPARIPLAPTATFKYYTVSGATLRGRSTAAGHSYFGMGCTYGTNAADLIFNTELPIPDGATIKYLRVYYNDTSATGLVRGYITRYQPGQATTDLVTVASTAAGASGYGFVVSAEITEIADNTDYAYTLIGWPSEASSSTQICGLRVAYYAP